VKHKVTGQEYALKSIEKSRINPELFEDMRSEISILQMVRQQGAGRARVAACPVNHRGRALHTARMPAPPLASAPLA
jgi:hypothetical protein